MKIQCSPHTIYEGSELLLRKANRMAGFRMIVGEPCDDNFEKLRLGFLNFSSEFRIAQDCDGKMLLRYLTAQVNDSGQPPDLILLNLNMPVVNGTDALDLIRRNETLSTTPIIVYRLYADERLETVMMSRGKQTLELNGFIYSDLKSFIVDLEQILLQMLPGSGPLLRMQRTTIQINNLCL